MGNQPGGVNYVSQPGVIIGIWSAEGLRATYRSAKQALSLHATPNVIATLVGSATKTVRVIGLRISGAAATASQDIPFVVNKHSAANSGGTATQPPAVLVDSLDAAATAVFNVYTVDPTMGAKVGALMADVVSCGLATVAGGSPVVNVPLVDAFGKPVFLRGVAESIAIDLAGVTLANATTMNVEIIWTEE